MSGNKGWVTGLVLLMLAAIGSGCSSSTPPGNQADATSNNASSAEGGNADASLITASIEKPDLDDEPEEDLDDGDTPIVEPKEGTPEWYIREILKIRLMPFPIAGKSTAENSEDSQSTSSDDGDAQAEKLTQIRRERNLEVIELAKQAIALTHKDAEKELIFNAAVHHLLDARLQLALAGDQEDVNALYEVAEALQASKPNSEAAAAAALTVVNFAHANAVRYAQSEPRWIQEFSRQAQLFAGKVSDGLAAVDPKAEASADAARRSQLQKDASRAAQILMAAGQSCDAAGFADDAKACYSLIKTKFPKSPQAEQATGILRRMNLKGQPLQLAGPTLDGNFISIEDFKGKTVLVVFWASEAKPFLDQLPALAALQKKWQKYISVVGVCLDTDEFQLDNFLAEQGLTWPQIFESEPEKRGWNSPMANYYGINNLPTIWIVDPNGVVAEADVTSADLEVKLKEVVRKSLPSKAGGQRIQPASGTSPEK